MVTRVKEYNCLKRKKGKKNKLKQAEMSANNVKGSTVKCGYCGWIMSYLEIQAHKCFETYDENIHVIFIDETGHAIIKFKEAVENMQSDILPLKCSETTTYSVITMDEMLIDAVQQRPALWNYKLPVQKRTSHIKRALWDEIFNNLGFRDAAWMKCRWTYLRDCYTKARKKVNSYVPSGSATEAGHTQKSMFRFYTRMQFIDKAESVTPTTSSLPCNIKSEEDNELNLTNLEFQESSTFSPSCNTPDIPIKTESSIDWGLSQINKQKKRKQSEPDVQALHANVLNQLLVENEPKKDVVDSFLEQMGHILRKLSYLRRRQVQLDLLHLLHKAEDEQLAEDSIRQ